MQLVAQQILWKPFPVSPTQYVLCHFVIAFFFLQITPQMLEKISEEFLSSIVRENGLAALLNYLHFFSIAVQRTAP